ncbi:MAG: hypothetical protein K1060chlam5_00457 [Candidatus Anoxychlamydiales bacterium]|nr:hypothetical protein [Candidatus Anoxychlamydiales bacterium]
MKKNKLILYISFAIVTSIILLIASFPKILSTTSFKNYVIKKTEKKTNSKISIETINLSWFGPQAIKNIDYKDSNIIFDANTIISDMNLFSFYKSLTSTSKKINLLTKTKISNLNIKISYPSYSPINLYNINAIITPKNSYTNIIITGSINNKTKESFNIKLDVTKNNNIKNLIVKNIPTIALDQFLFFNKQNLKGLLVQLLGPNLNANLKMNLKKNIGPIILDLNSTNVKTTINLYLDKNEFTLTDSIDINLDLQSGVRFKTTSGKEIFFKSDQNKKVTLKLSQNNFSCPYPFDMKKLKIGNLFINPNIIYTLNTNSLEVITNIAKMPYSNIISIWCTPVNIKVNDGILYTDRMDFLINNVIHLCTWGNINLINKKMHMNLGVTADALRYSYNVKNLNDDYVLKIPVKGSLDNIKIDPSSAIAKILALKALQSQGGIGSFIQGLITIKKDDDIPRAKKPFPWSGKVNKKSNSNENIFDVFK